MSRAPFDSYARGVITSQPHAIVAWWLMASYLYYHKDESLLTDEYFDELSAEMLDRWDAIKHPHKHIIDIGSLVCGSGFALAEAEYPSITKSAAQRLMHGAAF